MDSMDRCGFHIVLILRHPLFLSFSIYFQWEGLMGLGHLLGI
jgi:hypothetical protein